jgi:hypothetical protein
LEIDIEILHGIQPEVLGIEVERKVLVKSKFRSIGEQRRVHKNTLTIERLYANRRGYLYTDDGWTRTILVAHHMPPYPERYVPGKLNSKRAIHDVPRQPHDYVKIAFDLKVLVNEKKPAIGSQALLNNLVVHGRQTAVPSSIVDTDNIATPQMRVVTEEPVKHLEINDDSNYFDSGHLTELPFYANLSTGVNGGHPRLTINLYCS